MGVDVLPGATAASNLPDLTVFGATNRLFASGSGPFGDRGAGDAYYQPDFSLGYLAAAFDIASFESALPPFNIGSGAVGQGSVEISFADGDVSTFLIDGGDGSEIFFGFTTDTAITRIRWLEALEGGGRNEETMLDSLRVGPRLNTVPEPWSLLLAASALALLLRRQR